MMGRGRRMMMMMMMKAGAAQHAHRGEKAGGRGGQQVGIAPHGGGGRAGHQRHLRVVVGGGQVGEGWLRMTCRVENGGSLFGGHSFNSQDKAILQANSGMCKWII